MSKTSAIDSSRFLPKIIRSGGIAFAVATLSCSSQEIRPADVLPPAAKGADASAPARIDAGREISSDAGVETRAPDTAPPSLEVVTSGSIPLVEVSGLAKHGDTYYAVGDRAPVVVTFKLGTSGELLDVVSHDLSAKISVGKDGAQWEAVALDALGQVVILSEEGEIIVLDATLTNVVAHVPIDTAALRTMLFLDDDDDPGREGLVLLEDGHVLVVNEKDPAAFVELGLAGAAAKGFTRGGATPKFTPPAKLAPLAVWPLSTSQEQVLPDLSELAIAPDGALWALTQKGARAARLADSLKVGKPVAIEEVLDLPSTLKTAEGLAFSDNAFVVGCDLAKLGATNIFQLVRSP